MSVRWSIRSVRWLAIRMLARLIGQFDGRLDRSDGRTVLLYVNIGRLDDRWTQLGDRFVFLNVWLLQFDRRLLMDG